MADADRKMRITKKGEEKTRNASGKQKNNLRREIFLSSRSHEVGPFTYIQNVMPIVDTDILYPVIVLS